MNLFFSVAHLITVSHWLYFPSFLFLARHLVMVLKYVSVFLSKVMVVITSATCFDLDLVSSYQVQLFFSVCKRTVMCCDV